MLRDFLEINFFFTNIKRELVYLFVFINIKAFRLCKIEPKFCFY